MRISWILLGSVLFSGCFANASPTKRLTDTVHELNDNTRWGRLGTAGNMVQPDYRMAFAERHAAWGKDIQVADMEVTHMQMAADKETASTLVTYEWYQRSTMTLHSTVIKQTWKRFNDHYGLAAETVVQGDGRLLGQAEDVADLEPVSLLGDPTEY